MHPQKASLPMVFKPSCKVTFANDLQPLNVLLSIVVTFWGITILCNPELLNPPTDSNVLGSSIDVKLLQPLKAPSPMLIRRSGSEMEANWLQPLNAPLPIVCNSNGKDIDVKEVQSLKVSSCISITFSGISIAANFLHLLNARFPRIPRPAGSVAEVSSVQP